MQASDGSSNECRMSGGGNDVGLGGGDIERDGERQWMGRSNIRW